MDDSGTNAGGFILKAIATPTFVGIMAGAIGFMFLWPKTKKEGYIRIVASGLFSHLFGNAVLHTILHYADWISIEDMRAGAYLIAGLPGWFLLCAIFRYFENNKKKDISQLFHNYKDKS